MDKEVLIRAIQAIELILGRINSKRLLVLYGYLLFLGGSKYMTADAVEYGSYVTVICLLLLMLKLPSDAQNAAPNDGAATPSAGDIKS